MPNLAAAAVALCTWKDCNKPATHSYRWHWGEEGKTCPDCIPLIRQCGENLGGPAATLTQLDTQAEPPVTRSERTQLIAAKLSAEAELEEVTKRGQQLYQQNVDLSQQVQTHVMRAREHEGILQRHAEQIENLAERLEVRERQLAEVTNELQRLQVLAPFVGEATTQTSRVDGSQRGLTGEELAANAG